MIRPLLNKYQEIGILSIISFSDQKEFSIDCFQRIVTDFDAHYLP